MASAVGDAAEHAMTTATAACDVARKAAAVREMLNSAGGATGAGHIYIYRERGRERERNERVREVNVCVYVYMLI